MSDDRKQVVQITRTEPAYSELNQIINELRIVLTEENKMPSASKVVETALRQLHQSKVRS